MIHPFDSSDAPMVQLLLVIEKVVVRKDDSDERVMSDETG